MITTLLLAWQWLIAPGRAYNGWEPRIALPGECGKREYYNECGSSCRLDCHSSQVYTSCKSQTCQQGCYCMGGLYRNGKGGPCVKRQMCKKFHTSHHGKVNEEDLADILNDLLNNCNSSFVPKVNLCEKSRSQMSQQYKERLIGLLWRLIKRLRSSEGIPVKEKGGIPTEDKYVLRQPSRKPSIKDWLF